jgi:hypothetical protein
MVDHGDDRKPLAKRGQRAPSEFGLKAQVAHAVLSCARERVEKLLTWQFEIGRECRLFMLLTIRN